jgi:hypothetical protein
LASYSKSSAFTAAAKTRADLSEGFPRRRQASQLTKQTMPNISTPDKLKALLLSKSLNKFLQITWQFG